MRKEKFWREFAMNFHHPHWLLIFGTCYHIGKRTETETRPSYGHRPLGSFVEKPKIQSADRAWLCHTSVEASLTRHPEMTLPFWEMGNTVELLEISSESWELRGYGKYGAFPAFVPHTSQRDFTCLSLSSWFLLCAHVLVCEMSLKNEKEESKHCRERHTVGRKWKICWSFMATSYAYSCTEKRKECNFDL